MFQGFDTTGERVPLADAKLLAPVIPRSKVVCVGLNYPEHRQDMAANVDAPENPLIFLKPNTAVIGPGRRHPDPAGRGPHHARERTRGRDRQDREAGAEGSAGPTTCSATPAATTSRRATRCSPTASGRARRATTPSRPIGPWIETELDPTNLEISSTVDGEPRRHGNTRDLIHKIPELIAYISDIWTLLPGDIIMTGTPSGLGGFVDGQVVDITIEGIGTLSNPARNRDAAK